MRKKGHFQSQIRRKRKRNMRNKSCRNGSAMCNGIAIRVSDEYTIKKMHRLAPIVVEKIQNVLLRSGSLLHSIISPFPALPLPHLALNTYCPHHHFTPLSLISSSRQGNQLVFKIMFHFVNGNIPSFLVHLLIVGLDIALNSSKIIQIS